VAAGYAGRGGLSNFRSGGTYAAMINRGDIIWLGVASGVTGGLIGGLMLGIGIAMMLSGIYFGFLLVCIGGPASGLIGWVMARRLAKQL
jgi:hypothetical protein